ncbi:aminoglycoside phosphotransferase family protein [Kineosporia sp. A_224]|uniref:aminoglycoside phosphotransferase family protein n=1 Tax=Kineosporia sp. A_224 TaxID=1962180 RepID=UPI001303F687|nr:aminoglycoside phosphotransferase family protein [Kineosporia sp. A_224]
MLALPSQLRAVAASGDEPGLAEWVADRLPAAVGAARRYWGLRLEPPYEPGGYCSWVAPGVDARGRSAVLKVGWPHEDSAHEPVALRAWAGDGAVLLLDVLDDLDADGTRALLLERCDPGVTLGETFTGADEPQQDVVLAGVLRRLRAAPVPPGLPTLEAMCVRWSAEFRRQREALAGAAPLDDDTVAAGLAEYVALAASAPEQVLLCTDLHAGNVLSARREPWLVIDPKPHVGDAAYDATQHLLNCPARVAADPVGLARRMAGLLDVDPDRVVRWLFARGVVESLDMPVAAGVAADLAVHLGVR